MQENNKKYKILTKKYKMPKKYKKYYILPRTYCNNTKKYSKHTGNIKEY